jgi:hypothetical protein
MRYTIQSKILKEVNENYKKTLSNYVTSYNSDKELTVGEIKTMVKESQSLLPTNWEISEEKLYVGNREMKDNNIILKDLHGLEYNLIYK